MEDICIFVVMYIIIVVFEMEYNQESYIAPYVSIRTSIYGRTLRERQLVLKDRVDYTLA